MKIAFIHQPISTISVTEPNGSIEIFTYEVAKRLAKNCEVIVYAKRGSNQKEYEYDSGVQYRRISTKLDEWYTYLSYSFDKLRRTSMTRALSENIRQFLFYRNVRRPFFASRWYYINFALEVAKRVREDNCDIVHINTFSQFIPIIRAYNPKIKIVLHIQCEWLTQLDQKMIQDRLINADLILGCSDYVTEKIRSRFPKFANRCQTLYNGVNVDRFVKEKILSSPKKENFKQILFVGRVSPEKGVHVLLDSLKKVVKLYPQVQLKICGYQGSLPIEYHVTMADDPIDLTLASFYNGDYISYLQTKLSSDLSSHVSFTGSLPHEQLISFYQNADVFVVPSVWNEPFGIPIIEAMVTGVPLVATRGGGIPEIVCDGETGLLVERNNARALTEAILRFLSNEDFSKSVGEAERNHAVKLFSWEKIAENLLSQYKKIYEHGT